jgi:tripartite-type tricarboxylate transporter receptor subunit TctC
MPDILSGRIASYWATPSTALQHIQAGKLRTLATTGLKRSPTLPDVPTVAESGYPGFEAVNWYAFVGPAKMSPELADRWNKELVKVLTDPTVVPEMLKHGLEPHPARARSWRATSGRIGEVGARHPRGEDHRG